MNCNNQQNDRKPQVAEPKNTPRIPIPWEKIDEWLETVSFDEKRIKRSSANYPDFNKN